MDYSIDWSTCESRLSMALASVMSMFGRDHPDEQVSFLALYADYCYGHVAIAIDTIVNEATQVTEQVDRVCKTREMLFNRDDGWRNARYFISRSSDRITDHTPSVGLFAYPEVLISQFPEWEQYFRSDDFNEEYGLEDRVIVLFWKALSSLATASTWPFHSARFLRLGFEFHDSPLGLIVTHRVNLDR